MQRPVLIFPFWKVGRLEGKMLREYFSTLSKYRICPSEFKILNFPTSPYFFLIEKSPKAKFGEIWGCFALRNVICLRGKRDMPLCGVIFDLWSSDMLLRNVIYTPLVCRYALTRSICLRGKLDMHAHGVSICADALDMFAGQTWYAKFRSGSASG